MLHTPRKVPALLAAVAIAAFAPALAAEGPTFEGGPVHAATEARLALVVPPDPRRPLVKVRLSVAEGMSIGGCVAEPEWMCRYEPRDGVGPAVIEWVRRAGTSPVKPFTFLLTASNPGRFPLALTRVSAPSVTVRFDDSRGAVGPAPVLNVLSPVTTTALTVTTSAPGAGGRDGSASSVAPVAAAFAAAFIAAGGVALWRRRRRFG